MNLKGNTILVTGGTSGFGFEFASKLITLQNTVIITGRNEEKLQQVKDKLPLVHTVQSDVSKKEDIVELYNKITTGFPDLNIIINNAGEMRKISVHHDHSLDDITREIDINLKGPIHMVQQFLPHLKKQKYAAVVNVTSGIALMPFPISPIYSASKSGLRFYTQALRVQLNRTNIKVFELVAPGSSTPLNNKFVNEDGFNPKMLMDPEKLIDVAIRGLKDDTLEIYPGAAKLIRILSRLAPKFVLSQSSKMGASFMYGKQSIEKQK